LKVNFDGRVPCGLRVNRFGEQLREVDIPNIPISQLARNNLTWLFPAVCGCWTGLSGYGRKATFII